MEARPTAARPIDRDDWWWIFDPRLSLRARAVLVLGGGAAVFAWLLVWLAGAAYRQQLEPRLGAEFETLAFQIGDKLDRTIYERYRQLELAAGLASFRVAATAPAERRRVLDALLDASPDFAWLGFVTPDGNIAAATQGMLEHTSVAGQRWFRSAREQPFVGSVQEQVDLARLVRPVEDEGPARFLELAVPVTSAEGRFLGVLGAQVYWAFAREVQRSVIPETARRLHLGATVYTATGDVLLDSGGSGWNAPPAAPALADPRRARGSLAEATPEGAHYLTGYARSPGFRVYRGLGWLVTVRQPTDDALAPVRELRRTLAKWSFVLVGAVAVVGWVLAGRLARRLVIVAAAARRIRAGDVLTVMPQPAGDDEVARMCGALGEMVEDLRATRTTSVHPPAPPAAPPPS